MNEQEIEDIREELRYFTSGDLKENNPELYQDKEFTNYCKELLKLNDGDLSQEHIQEEYNRRYKKADRKAFVLFASKDKDEGVRAFACSLLSSPDGEITPLQYDELLKKMNLARNEREKKKIEKKYKRLKFKEYSLSGLSEQEEEQVEELEAELPEDLIKQVEEEIAQSI